MKWCDEGSYSGRKGGEGETKQSLLSDSLMQSCDCLFSTVILLSPGFYDFNR